MCKTYTEQDLKNAYEAGIYEGAGDDAWYADHSNDASDLDDEAMVHKPMNEYVKEIKLK